MGAALGHPASNSCRFLAASRRTTAVAAAALAAMLPAAAWAGRLSGASPLLVAAVATAAGVGLGALVGWRLRVAPRRLVTLHAREADAQAGRFDTALNNISQGVCFFDGGQRLIVANRRYSEMYDLSPELARPGTTLAEIVDHRFAVGAFPAMTRAEYLAWRESFAVSPVSRDSLVKLRNGRVIAIHHRPMPGNGWVATHEDVTARHDAEARITHMARHDALTGLANRVALWEALGSLEAAPEPPRAALVLLDLDRFKAINDTLGHPVGDGLLAAVGARLRACARGDDLAVRLGGDEFAIVQRDADPDAAVALGERVLQAIRQDIEVAGHRLRVTASVGIALVPSHARAPEELMLKADLALYHSKAAGPGRASVFAPAMQDDLLARRRLEADLREATAASAFELAFQPIVRASDGATLACEALLRWRHPEHGLIPPGEFIAVAEEIGLIGPIGEWVLHRACAAAVQWPEPLRVTVNLSPAQLSGGQIVEQVRSALRNSGLAPGRLELEITETALLVDSEGTSRVLHALAALGVDIALDDFGTGYSSLNHLRIFPFRRLKIDRSFVRDMETREDGIAIVAGVLALARSLGIPATAEGVETRVQAEALQALGCSDLQGYYFARPAAAAETLERLASRQDLRSAA